MNKIMKGSLLTLAFSSVCFISACANRAPQKNVISISPLDPGHIKVEYTLVSDSIELSDFYGSITPQLRNNWKPLNNCSQLLKGAILAKNKGCKKISFSVPIEASFVDRVEPPAYPMDEEGVLIHTGTFSIKDNDVIWEFSSPKGSLIIDGTNRGSKTIVDGAQDPFIFYTGVFLSYKKLAADTSVIATKTTPAKLTDRVTTASKQISHYYQTTYPARKFLPPLLFINNINQTSNTNLQADVSSHRMIRFGFFNWQENEQALDEARGIAAHEFAHILQPKNMYYPNYGSIVTEGGAEFIRWIAEYHLGWRSKDQLADNFSSALYGCISVSNNQAWKAIKDYQGQIPYQCGLAAHVIALASRKNNDSAEQTVADFYSTFESNPTVNFAQALECTHSKDCTANFLPQFLESERSLYDLVDTQLNLLGLVKSKRYGKNASSSTQVSAKAFESLMIEDCGGVDYYSNSDHFSPGNMRKCKALSAGDKISSVNGISYFSESFKAIEAQNQGCTNKHQVILGTLDNKKITVTCNKTFVPQKYYYEIDIYKLLILLDKH